MNDEIPVDDRRAIADPLFAGMRITDATRRELFGSLRDYLAITERAERIAWTRAQGVSVWSFTELTEAQGRKLLNRIEEIGPIQGVKILVDVDMLSELLDAHPGFGTIAKQIAPLRRQIAAARLAAKMGHPTCD